MDCSTFIKILTTSKNKKNVTNAFLQKLFFKTFTNVYYNALLRTVIGTHLWFATDLLEFGANICRP